MNPLDFLKTELEKVSKNFTNVQFKYEYNNIISTHIVEILPLDEYLHNDKLSETWIPLSIEFGQIFPNEEIAFISSDSILRINDPIFEFNILNQNFTDISSFYAPITQQEFHYSFPEVMSNGGIAIGASIEDVLSSPEQIINTNPDTTNYYLAAA